MITGLFGLDLLIVRIRILMMRFLGLCMGKVYDVFMFYVLIFVIVIVFLLCLEYSTFRIFDKNRTGIIKDKKDKGFGSYV